MAAELPAPVIGIGLAPTADVRASEVRVDREGVGFHLYLDADEAEVASPLLGLFNVHNLLMAAAVGQVAGFTAGQIASALATAPAVPGRMERLPAPEGVTILLDYAHKPEALRGALQACRELAPEGRVLVVFGCGGDRDRGKRPLMGRIAALGADEVFVTSDSSPVERFRSALRKPLNSRPGRRRVGYIATSVSRVAANTSCNLLPGNQDSSTAPMTNTRSLQRTRRSPSIKGKPRVGSKARIAASN